MYGLTYSLYHPKGGEEGAGGEAIVEWHASLFRTSWCHKSQHQDLFCKQIIRSDTRPKVKLPVSQVTAEKRHEHVLHRVKVLPLQLNHPVRDKSKPISMCLFGALIITLPTRSTFSDTAAAIVAANSGMSTLGFTYFTSNKMKQVAYIQTVSLNCILDNCIYWLIA